MTITKQAGTGEWTIRLTVLRDGSDLVLCLTVRHTDTGETYRALRRGPGVRAMATEPLAAQLDWIEETVQEGNWRAAGALKMARSLTA